MAERVTRQLSERLGEAEVAAHHGSLAKEQRLDAEQRLKRGALQALVATASLELGIDIGDVDLVCQLGSPRSIASFLQRVGRSGHAIDGTPKGRLFPLSRDELVECTALLDSVRRGELDRLRLPEQPLDVLAQQIVAEVAAREWREDELYALLRRAWPYRALARADFDAVVGMLAEGFSTRRGRRGALIHHDAVNHVLRGRRGARLTALTSGGTIPDTADYQVVLEPESQVIGTRERGLRGREHGRRRLPARQRVLPHPAGRARHRPGRGRARPAADDPVLAGRGAGAQRRAVGLGLAPAGGDRGPPRDRPGRRGRAALADRWSSASTSRPRAAGRLSGRGARGAGLPADPGHGRARALLRRSRRHAAGDPLALRQPHQPRLGTGAAQALLPQVQLRAAGGGDRGQHRAVADHGAQLRAWPRCSTTCTRRASGRC